MDRAIELVTNHCDLAERLADVPRWAKIRGLFLVSAYSQLNRVDKLAAYRRYFPEKPWNNLSYYPLSDFLSRLAVCGALLESPERVHDGMARAMRHNAGAFASSLVGKVLIQTLCRDRLRLTEQGMAARRLSFNYGQWSITAKGPDFIEVTYQSEYVWLESAVNGSAIGAFEACGLSVAVQTTLHGKYDGVSRITWQK